jgi:hypothetical protein
MTRPEKILDAAKAVRTFQARRFEHAAKISSESMPTRSRGSRTSFEEI